MLKNFAQISFIKNKILGNTFKRVIYTKQNNNFAVNVDESANFKRSGWGHFIADGWSKLTKYDKNIEKKEDDTPSR